MITLIDSAGREVDPAPYRERLIAPVLKQEEIRQWVARAEEQIHENSAETTGVREFLRRFTYTQNLLDEPYQPSADSLAETTNYGISLLPLPAKIYSAAELNKRLYYLEKVARLGVNLQLSLEDRENITEVENDYYTIGEEKLLLRLIKMLGRHARLGLPEIEPERKKYLQEILMSDRLIFPDWLGCSALRAGFTLPPCPVGVLAYHIQERVEQKRQNLEGVLIFGSVIFSQEERRQMMQDKGKRLDAYVTGAHHLKRLFGEG